MSRVQGGRWWGAGGQGCRLTFSRSTPPYLARIRGSRTVARLVPVTVRRVPPLEGVGSHHSTGQTESLLNYPWGQSSGCRAAQPAGKHLWAPGSRAPSQQGDRDGTGMGQCGAAYLLMLHSGSIFRTVGSSV